MDNFKNINLASLQRSIIIFLVAMIASVSFSFLSKLIPWKTIMAFPLPQVFHIQIHREPTSLAKIIKYHFSYE